MAKTLKNKEMKVISVTDVAITSIINSPKRKMVIIKYDVIASDGNVVKSDALRIKGAPAVKELYDELDVLIRTGLSFEQASRQLLYAKIGL